MCTTLVFECRGGGGGFVVELTDQFLLHHFQICYNWDLHHTISTCDVDIIAIYQCLALVFVLDLVDQSVIHCQTFLFFPISGTIVIHSITNWYTGGTSTS